MFADGDDLCFEDALRVEDKSRWSGRRIVGLREGGIKTWVTLWA